MLTLLLILVFFLIIGIMAYISIMLNDFERSSREFAERISARFTPAAPVEAPEEE